MTIIHVKTHKLYIIKKRSHNKVSFVEFIFNSRIINEINIKYQKTKLQMILQHY